MKRILGIDEAGRGPVIGPLVMCGYMIEESSMNKLKKTGVRDSKLLSPTQRESISKQLHDICIDYTVLKTDAAEIDEVRSVTNLNRLEIEKMTQIINLMKPDTVYIDAIEANVKKFEKKIAVLLDEPVHIVAENYADKTYPVVSAASVMAKVARDSEIQKLHKKYGFFGSRYSSDQETVRFLKTWIENNKEFPPCVRRSWITAMTMKNEKEQKKLMDFGD